MKGVPKLAFQFEGESLFHQGLDGDAILGARFEAPGGDAAQHGLIKDPLRLGIKCRNPVHLPLLIDQKLNLDPALDIAPFGCGWIDRGKIGSLCSVDS